MLLKISDFNYNKGYIYGFLLIVLFQINIPSAYSAEDIRLGNIPLSVSITDTPKIVVQKPGGGWYSSMTLENINGSDPTLYQGKLPIEVILTGSDSFKVSLYEKLVIRNEQNPSLYFNNENVTFSKIDGPKYTLGSEPIKFNISNRVESIYKQKYLISVSAKPPAGSIPDIKGKYSGNLTMIFEPEI